MHLKAEATRTESTGKDPGEHAGNDSVASAAGSHPKMPALRPSHSRAKAHSTLT